jgi:hypothetical protein
VTDVKDFLFFNPRTEGVRMPSVIDLSAININRGREHGVPGYVFYLEYCTGTEIKSWKDLTRFIPEARVNQLRGVYRFLKVLFLINQNFFVTYFLLFSGIIEILIYSSADYPNLNHWVQYWDQLLVVLMVFNSITGNMETDSTLNTEEKPEVSH